MKANNERREFLRASAAVRAGLILAGCASGNREQANTQSSSKSNSDKKGIEVTASEDLMREHGVLRRALLVYTAAAGKLRTNAQAAPPDALHKTAKLFRSFGEDGYEDAIKQIGDIKGSLGLSDISQFTPPPSPKVTNT